MALSVPRLLPTKTYPFSDLRHTLAATGIQPGVMATTATTEFKVTQDTGSNMNVKVLQGDSGAWVNGLDTTRQGAYHVYNDAAITTAVSAANATNPRIDQVVLRVYDSTVIGGGTDAATIEVIAGTATAGATLDNRTGAANLATIAAPKSLIRLADVLVPAASTAVTNANIRDRRPWALGAYNRIVVSSDYVRNVNSFVEIDTTNLKPRIECSGVPVRVTMRSYVTAGTASTNVDFVIYMDGTQVTVANGGSVYRSNAPNNTPLNLSWELVPAAGSHLFAPAWSQPGATTFTLNGATAGVVLTVEEIARQNVNNT